MNTNIDNLLNLIDKMSVLELNELLKILEQKFNFSSNLNLLNSNNKNIDIKEEEKTFSLYLKNVGNNKISIIKLIKEVNNLSLKEAKDLVDSCPVLIKGNSSVSTLESLKKKFEDSGAEVEIK